MLREWTTRAGRAKTNDQRRCLGWREQQTRTPTVRPRLTDGTGSRHSPHMPSGYRRVRHSFLSSEYHSAFSVNKSFHLFSLVWPYLPVIFVSIGSTRRSFGGEGCFRTKPPLFTILNELCDMAGLSVRSSPHQFGTEQFPATDAERAEGQHILQKGHTMPPDLESIAGPSLRA